MLQSFISLLKGLPGELATVIVAAMPVAELRGSIPLGLLTFKLPLVKVLILSIIGNLIPVVPLLLFLNPISERLRRFRLWSRFFDWLFTRTRKKAQLIEKYEAIGLALFVAVPLPITGAWSGCIAASLFKIKFHRAFLAVTAGVCIAAAIVTAVTLTGEGIFFRLFLAR